MADWKGLGRLPEAEHYIVPVGEGKETVYVAFAIENTAAETQDDTQGKKKRINLKNAALFEAELASTLIRENPARHLPLGDKSISEPLRQAIIEFAKQNRK